MNKPAAKQGDKVVGLDTHVLMVPSPGGPVPTPTPMPFQGDLAQEISADVFIQNKGVATRGSVALNSPQHVPAAGPFQKPPSNRGTVKAGNSSVLVNGKPMARLGDPVETCSDPADAPNGVVIADSSVWLGD